MKQDATPAILDKWAHNLSGQPQFQPSDQRRRATTATRPGVLHLPVSHAPTQQGPLSPGAVPLSKHARPPQSPSAQGSHAAQGQAHGSPVHNGLPSSSVQPSGPIPEQTKLMKVLNSILPGSKPAPAPTQATSALQELASPAPGNQSAQQGAPPRSQAHHQLPLQPAQHQPAQCYPFVNGFSPARHQRLGPAVKQMQQQQLQQHHQQQQMQQRQQHRPHSPPGVPEPRPDPSTQYAQHFTPVKAPMTDPVMTALSSVAYTSELLRKESTARTLGLRCLLDFIYDNFDSFEEASKKVTGGKANRTPMRAVLREAMEGALRGAGAEAVAPGARLWVQPSLAARPAPRDPNMLNKTVRIASLSVDGLNARDPRASNHLYNVAQTLHLARPDIVALQCVGHETTPAKLAALLNLWAEPHDGTWMAAVVPPVAAQQHGAQQGAGAVGAPTHLQAFLWREQPQVTAVTAHLAVMFRCVLVEGAPPQRPPHSAAHTAAAAQSVCGLWRVHGQYLMLGNACLRRRQSSDARGASPGQKERHEDITALYEQVRAVSDALGHAYQERSTALQEHVTLALAFSRDPSPLSTGAQWQHQGPQAPHPHDTTRAVMGQLHECGFHLPLVDPRHNTLIAGDEHTDNICMRQGSRGVSASSLAPVPGGSGVLGVGHLAPPADHCTHRLVWADLTTDPSHTRHNTQAGYGLDTEVSGRDGWGGQRQGQYGGRKDSPPLGRNSGPTGTYAQVVSGKGGGYGLDADISSSRQQSPRTTPSSWKDSDADLGYGLLPSERTKPTTPRDPPARSGGYGLAEEPRGARPSSGPGVKTGFGLDSESPDAGRKGYGLGAEEPRKGGYGLGAEKPGAKGDGYGLGSELGGKTSTTAAKPSYGLGAETSGRPHSPASPAKPSSSYGLGAETSSKPSSGTSSKPTGYGLLGAEGSSKASTGYGLGAESSTAKPSLGSLRPASPASPRVGGSSASSYGLFK